MACRDEVRRGKILTLVKDIQCIKKKFVKMGFTWVPREGNGVAHQIAFLVSQKLLPVNWVLNQPNSLYAIIQKEKQIQLQTDVVHVFSRHGIN